MSKKKSARKDLFTYPASRRGKTIKTFAPQSWSELAYICDTSNLHLQEAANILVGHIQKRWKYYKLLQDPNNYPYVCRLLARCDYMAKKYGANKGRKKVWNSTWLKRMRRQTGVRWDTYKTFTNDIREWNKLLGNKTRKYTKSFYDSEGDKEFSIHNAPRKTKN